MNDTIAVGDIITIDAQQVRVDQLSKQRAYVTPLRYSMTRGLVRSGRSYWADVEPVEYARAIVDESASWDGQMQLVDELATKLRAAVSAARAAGLDGQWVYDAVDALRDELS